MKSIVGIIIVFVAVFVLAAIFINLHAAFVLIATGAILGGALSSPWWFKN